MEQKNDPILSQVPILNPDVEFVIREDIVYIIKRNNTKLHNFLRKFKKSIPHTTEIEFDQISSRAFMLIDGERNIYEIGQIIHTEFGEDAEPLYERLVVYYDSLAANLHYITLNK